MAKYLEMEARAGMMSTAKLSEGRKQPEPAKKEDDPSEEPAESRTT